MTQSTRALTPKELGAGKAVQACARDAKALFADAARELGVVDPAQRMRAERALTWVGESPDPAQFAANLLQHHIRIQKAKPPAGKRSWYDLMNDGSTAIRPAYRRDEFQQLPDSYVHQYRTTPLWSFAKELERVRIKDEQD